MGINSLKSFIPTLTAIMTKSEVEIEVTGNYPVYVEQLTKIETDLNNLIASYSENSPDLIKNGDFRPGSVMRMVVCCITNRFNLDRSIEFISKNKWENEYLKAYQPKVIDNPKYFGLIKDIDTSIRFNIFHSFFHQFEHTIRNIHKSLNLGSKKHPIILVNRELKFSDEEFLECLFYIRNTIHNNGYFKPIGKQKEEFEYKFDDFGLVFKKNSGIDLNTYQTIEVVSVLKDKFKSLLNNEKVKAIPITIDNY